MGRILAIDYGTKRTGIAVTDPLQIIANGLTTVASYQLIPFLEKYFRNESVERVVIGKPSQPNGKPSENARHVQIFLRKFTATFPNMPIEEYDERFTSVLAHQAILQSGIPRMARRNKALVDEISATIILQSYMESLSRTHQREDTLSNP